MGGKGGSNTAPVYTPPPQEMNFEPMMAAMGEMMLMASSMNAPKYEPPPAIIEAPTIDWTAKQKEVASKANIDITEEMKRRRGRASTVLTSPLVNEEDPLTVFATAKKGQ